jgi:tetratricopeptide (TPR) repeat protein
MNILKFAIIVSLFLTSQQLHSTECTTGSNVICNEADIAVLPPYCRARMLNDKDPSFKEWNHRLGPDFIHIHHYCFGLYKTNKGNMTLDKGEKEELYTSAIGEMEYLFAHASPTFKMLPRISYDQGQLYEKRGKTGEAMQAYQKSINLNPKLPMPYAALSDLFKKQKNNKEAILILEQGLKYKPTSKALLKRMEKLTKDK